MSAQFCARCECRCPCCLERLADERDDGRIEPLPQAALRVLEEQPGVWLFLDYPPPWENLRYRWAVRASPGDPDALEVFSPTHGATHESALGLPAREMRLARDAIAAIRARRIAES